MNLGRRIECGFALLATMYNNQHGGKKIMSDFTPHEDQPIATIEEVAALFGAVPRG